MADLVQTGAVKTELKAAISTAQKYAQDNADKYSSADITVLKSLIETAKGVYKDADATQEETDAQVVILNTYIENMQALGKTEVVKDGLHEMLLTASNMAGRDSTFTKESITALKTAIEAADKVYANEDATQKEVNEQTRLLYNAILALDAKDTGNNNGGNNGGNNDDNNDDDNNDDGNDSLDINSLKDGVYSVTGSMVKIDKATASMSNEAINHTLKLTVKDGKYYLTIDFKGIAISSQYGYLSKLQYFLTGYTMDQYGAPQGSLNDVTVDSYQKNADGTLVSDSYGTDYPDLVTFELIPEALKDGYVPLQVFVPIMEAISTGTGTQPVFLKLDLSTVKSTTADDPDFNDNGNNDNNNNNNNDNNTLGTNALKPGSNALTSGSSLKSGSTGLTSTGNSKVSAAKTGDTNKVSGVAALLAASAMVMVVVLLERRKRREK